MREYVRVVLLCCLASASTIWEVAKAWVIWAAGHCSWPHSQQERSELILPRASIHLSSHYVPKNVRIEQKDYNYCMLYVCVFTKVCMNGHAPLTIHSVSLRRNVEFVLTSTSMNETEFRL